jgi:hypothetical protein
MTDAPLDAVDQRTIRRVRDLVEPLAASVYFAPECHENYDRLGFGPSPGSFLGVEGPERRAYFTSRGACLGQVPGVVIASAFGVFDPAVVVPMVTEGWAIAGAEALLDARLDGQQRFLVRALSAPPDDLARATALLRRMADAACIGGHALHAGLRSIGWPGDPIGDLWRAADLVREHRGDSHIIAWQAAGFSAPEILLLTELWWGAPMRSYSLTRGWSQEQFDAAEQRLEADGLVAGGQLTASGLDLRRRIETVTDRQELPLLAALGSDAGELFDLLEPMADEILAAGGYPRQAFSTSADLGGAAPS